MSSNFFFRGATVPSTPEHPHTTQIHHSR